MAGRKSPAKTESDLGYRAFVTAALLGPLLMKRKSDVKAGEGWSLRTADALCASLLASSLLKRAVPEKRPDSEKRDSFPSGHAMASFAVAATAAKAAGRAAPLWYLGAAVVALSRSAARRHHLHDTLIGAALGAVVGEMEARRSSGLLLTPVAAHAKNGKNANGRSESPKEDSR